MTPPSAPVLQAAIDETIERTNFRLMETRTSVLTYWFGSSELDADPGADRQQLWFGKSEDTDAAIRERFSDLVARAAQGELDSWAEEPAGLLALVITLDQFPRHIHRGTGRMFAHDEHALRMCHVGLERRFDEALGHHQRSFLYLPLMHSERIEDQDRCIRLYDALAANAPAKFAEQAAAGLRFAHLHRDIIVRFGRYPHRNALLGRTSTAEEAEFLTQPNSSF